MSNSYALLIGIDYYFGYPLPGGLRYTPLGGCVRDINKVYNFLTARLELDPANITKLTASLGDGQPQEPESLWPTYNNMVKAFEELAQKAQTGDQIYIQYSGHGGRTRTMFDDLKGENAFDEGLVPPDIGKPNDPDACYLRDVEMHHLLQKFVDNKVRLTVVFDCCHSGGATRKIGGATKRGIGAPDMSPPPAKSAVGKKSELIARWRGSNAATSRSVSSQASWLFEPKGYTLLAACRANESAFEYPFGGESNGALTYWMLDTLAQAGPDTTWKMVADRVAAKVHGQFEQQTPMLQGEGDYVVFEAEKLESTYAVPVLDVEAVKRRVRLNAGEAHGLVEGTQFAVYPSTKEIRDESEPHALVELDRIGATDSWATVVEPDSPVTVEEGFQAVMLNNTAVRVQRAVRVVIEDAALREQVEAEIQAEGQGFLGLAEAEEGADFLVDQHKDRPDELVLLDTSGVEIPNLKPALRIDNEGAISQLVKRLVHLTQYRNVQMLDMPDPKMAAKLIVVSDAKIVNRPGDEGKIVITNAQSPNPENADDPTCFLNITVLALSSDWSITQIYPETGGFEPLPPGEDIPLPLDIDLDEGQTEGWDIIKVFATQSTTNFRWLELPSLDQPIRREITKRSLITDPLERMIASVTKEGTETRAVRLKSSPRRDRGWTVTQVDIRVSEEDVDESESEHELSPASSATPSRAPEQHEASEQSKPHKVQIDPQDLGLENPNEFQILVEFPEQPMPLESPQPSAFARGSSDMTNRLEERSEHAIQSAMKTIREMALQTDLMRKGIPGGSQPRMVKVKFGIKMDLKFGAFLAETTAGATMEIEMEWARRSDDVLRVLRAETDVKGALFTDADAEE